MAYTDPLIDIADRTKRSILGDLEWAANFGNQFKENWLGEQRIPEQVSQTRLADAQNRFRLSERLQNWSNDLESSAAQSEFNAWNNRYNVERIPELEAQRDLNRQWEMTQTQGNLDAFDSQQKLQQLQRDQQILESENQIEQLTFDRIYDQMASEIPDYATMTPSQRYEAMMNLANDRNADPRVKARIKRKYIEASEEDLANVRSYAAAATQLEALKRTVAQLGSNAPAGLITQYAQAQSELMKYQMLIKDPESIRLASELGMLPKSLAGYLIGVITGQFPLTDQQVQMATQAATGVAPYVASQPATQGPAAAQGMASAPQLSDQYQLQQPGTPTPVPQNAGFVPAQPQQFNPVGQVGQQQLVSQVSPQGEIGLTPQPQMISNPNAEFIPPAPQPDLSNVPMPSVPGAIAVVPYRQPEIFDTIDIFPIMTMAQNNGISSDLLEVLRNDQVTLASLPFNISSVRDLAIQVNSLPEGALKEILSELVAAKYESLLEMFNANR